MADGTCLENRRTVNSRTVGSNPTLSAKVKSLPRGKLFCFFVRDLNPRGRKALRKCDVITFLDLRKEAGPDLGCRCNCWEAARKFQPLRQNEKLRQFSLEPFNIDFIIFSYSRIVSPHFFNSINIVSKLLPFSVNSYSTFGGISG